MNNQKIIKSFYSNAANQKRYGEAIDKSGLWN